jgi:hypothetical protein
VELFFNLLWLSLSVGIFGFWIWSQRRWADHSLRATTRVQIMALAVLIVILLPVVSLTDDLQACTAPAEMEHLIRRIDMQHSLDASLQTVSLLDVNTLSLEEDASRLQALLCAPRIVKIALPIEGFLNVAGIRPPPLRLL